MGFIKDERDIMALETELLRYMFINVKIECKKEFEMLDADVPVIGSEIPAVRLSEALDILKKSMGKMVLRKIWTLKEKNDRAVCKGKV